MSASMPDSSSQIASGRAGQHAAVAQQVPVQPFPAADRPWRQQHKLALMENPGRVFEEELKHEFSPANCGRYLKIDVLLAGGSYQQPRTEGNFHMRAHCALPSYVSQDSMRRWWSMLSLARTPKDYQPR
jgi:hypothetical protein